MYLINHIPVPMIGLIAPIIDPLRLLGLTLTTVPLPIPSPGLVAGLPSKATTFTEARRLRSGIKITSSNSHSIASK